MNKLYKNISEIKKIDVTIYSLRIKMLKDKLKNKCFNCGRDREESHNYEMNCHTFYGDIAETKFQEIPEWLLETIGTLEEDLELAQNKIDTIEKQLETHKNTRSEWSHDEV